jgi:tartrate/fumarate subfamily iron-sulfur-dependent hydro-lyase beta chain
MQISTPISEEVIRSLHVGQVVEVSGSVFTGRDAVHRYLYEGGACPVDMRGAVLYHCGPVVVKENGVWVVKAAGPTTSIREEPYQAEVIRMLGLRGVIGKGGMGPKTLAACRELGCVYMHAIGGAAQVLADVVTEVRDVYFLEKFGSPEAIWHFVVERFPVVITMDAHGNSLHKDVEEHSRAKLEGLLAKI